MKILFLLPELLFAISLTAQHKENYKHFSFTMTTDASSEAIWGIWMDVENWKKWDIGLKDASKSQPLALGVKGHIIDLEGRKSKFELVEFEKGKSYTFKTRLPLSGLYIKRSLTKLNGQTQFTHEVWFKGLTSGLFAKMLGKEFRPKLPIAMENIKQIAEK